MKSAAATTGKRGAGTNGSQPGKENGVFSGLTTKVVLPVLVAVIAALVIAIVTPLGDKVKEWLFPTKVTVTGSVLVGGQPTEGVSLTLDGEPVDPTDVQGEFVLADVGKGEHELALEKVGTSPRKPYRFTVGDSDKKLQPLTLQPLVGVRFVHDEGQPAATVHYQAYVWLLGRPKALSRVKSVVYELPVWVGKGPVTASAKPFCYSVAGDVDFGFLGQHIADPVIATVTLRDGGQFKVAGLPNLPGQAHPDCAPDSPPPPPSGPPPPQPPPPPPPPPPGPVTRSVPDVVGHPFESAVAELGSAGFNVARREVDSDDPKGLVVGQAPEAGTSQAPGATITLDVSKGPTTLVTVPDVTDHSEADANAKLQDNGFEVRVLRQPVSDPNSDGIVLSQSPAGGTQRSSGSTVTIVVGHFSP